MNFDYLHKYELMNTRMFQLDKNIASGLAKNMDCIMINKTIIYNKNINDIKTIFIKADLLVYYIHILTDLLEKPNTNINIVIASSDWTFPNNIDKRLKPTNINDKKIFIDLINNPKINKVFVENLDEDLGDKVISIPLGINPNECPTNFGYFLQFENKNMNRPIKITNFNRNRTKVGQWEERGIVWDLCKTSWTSFFIENKLLPHKQYLTKLAEYPFTICVSGGGLDPCPKLFEAILVGVIPIIKKKTPQTNAFLDLPVVFVDDWNKDTINEQNLRKWYAKYIKYFTDEDKRKNVLEKLGLNYWTNKIKTA